MKKITIITLLLFCFSFFKVYAQGTVVVSSSNGINHGLRFSSAQSGERITSNPSDDTNNDTKGPKWGMNFFTNDTLRMFIYNDGRVRMRESLIVEKDLEVNKNLKLNNDLEVQENLTVNKDLYVLNRTAQISYLLIDPKGQSNGYNYGGIFFGGGGNGDYNSAVAGIASNQLGGGKYGSKNGLNFWTNSKLTMMMSADGVVGINTDPQLEKCKTVKLIVNGDIRAKGLLYSPRDKEWPDYVFEDSYNLISLNELENFVRKNKHLPNFLSVQQIKDEGGNIKVFNIIENLLKTIEEQTLYIIDVNKRLEKLEKTINND